ncbi:MAG: CHASE domain-containing protein, partial [Flavobacteriales bacterium]|nr:CHASE domain-containing protein [Flavobacteriales bacterium]
MRLNLDAISSIGSFHAVTDSVSRLQFEDYNQHTLERISSIQALEWIPHVLHAQRDDYESKAINDGLAGFKITEKVNGKMVRASDRAEYFPVYYVEPIIGNEAAIGFDLASNPARFAAIQKARTTNSVVATSRINLVQETATQKGMLVFNPINKDEVFIGFS